MFSWYGYRRVFWKFFTQFRRRTEVSSSHKIRQQRRKLTTKSEFSWNYETVCMFLVPILLGSAAVYVYWHSKRKSNITKIEEYIRQHYPIDDKELINLRRLWNLSIKEVLYLYECLKEKGFSNKSMLSLDAFLQYVFQCLQRRGQKIWLLQILKGFGENVTQLEVREWLLIFTMLTNANYEQRKVLAFAILDEDDDGMITEEDFETLIRVAMTVGWCYDTKMYKQTSKWPPDFVVKDPKEFAHELLKTKTTTNGTLVWENFKSIPVNLI